MDSQYALGPTLITPSAVSMRDTKYVRINGHYSALAHSTPAHPLLEYIETTEEELTVTLTLRIRQRPIHE